MIFVEWFKDQDYLFNLKFYLRKIENNLKHLHDLKFIYNNINLYNIMLYKDDIIMIIDFNTYQYKEEKYWIARINSWYFKKMKYIMWENDYYELQKIQEILENEKMLDNDELL